MKLKKFHIITLFLMVWNFSLSQQYTNYTVANGLPSNHVYQLIQDQQGFIWLVTDKGIVKYNGSEFKTYTTRQGLPTNDIWGIRITGDEKVWYFSKSAQLGYIDKDKVFAFPSSVPGEVLNPVAQHVGSDTVIVGNSRGFHKLNLENEWEPMETGIPLARVIAEVTHNRIARIVSNEARDSIHFIDKQGRLAKAMKQPNKRISLSIKGQLNDSIVYWGGARGITLCNLNTMEFFDRSFEEEIGVEAVRFTRIFDINNELQVTGSHFVARLDKEFHMVDVTHFPEHLNVHFACIDRDETIWMASFNKGMYKFPKSKRAINYSMLSNKVSQFNQVGERLVASIYDRGFFVFNESNKSFEPFLEQSGYILAASEVKEMDTQFYLTGNKVIADSKGRRTTYVSGTSGLKLNDLGRQLVYHEGSLYGNYSGGINRIDPSTLEVIAKYDQVGVYSLIRHQEKLYVGTPNGLKVIDGAGLKSVRFENDPFEKPILSIKEIDPNLLLITTDGYGAYTTDLSTIVPMERTEFLSVQDAFVEMDRIWLATDRGVWAYEVEGNTFRFEKSISESDGLPTRNINAVSVVGDQLVVGTDNGVAILPKETNKSITLLNLYFESAFLGTKEITSELSQFTYEKDNNARFVVAPISFSDQRDAFEYEYKLDPIQSNWIGTRSAGLNFTDLKPGSYSLRIRAGDVERSTEFEILPLWWQKPPVQIAGLVALLALVMFALFFMLKRIQQKQTRRLVQEKELAQIQLKALRSQMNPHFVFNSLSAIQYYINNNDFEASEAYLLKFSKLIRTFFELSRESEISLEEEVALLQNYLALEKLRFRGKFDYAVHLDPALNGDTGKIPAMLLQPIVENAINHGIFNKEEKGRVEVRFKKQPNEVIVATISDDGVGFVNTGSKNGTRTKSSNVLEDRLYYLNTGGRWSVEYDTREAFPEAKDKGNISTFTIKRIT